MEDGSPVRTSTRSWIAWLLTPLAFLFLSRRRLLILGPLLVLAGGLAVARWYLASPAVARQVEAALQDALGAPVRIASVELGLLGDSSIRGVEVFEVGASPSVAPWLTLDRVHADVSVFALLQHTLPRALDVVGAQVHLHFDADGRLRTRLPHGGDPSRPLPVIRLRESRVSLRQDERPELALAGVFATLSSAGSQAQVEGGFADPYWGNWQFNANLDRSTGTAAASLKTTRVTLLREHLESLPFVPAEVWQQFRAEGETPVELAVRFGGPDGTRYRVALEPTHTRLHVAAIDLDAHDARGRVVIEDGTVQLEDVEGRTADGTLACRGLLDFRGLGSRLAFGLQATGLNLARLPRSWGLPGQVQGRLSGKADLVFSIREGRSRTTGDGEGTITEARLLGFPARPIRLRLHADGDRFEFRPHSSTENMTRGATAPPTYLEAQLAVDDAELGTAIERLGLRLAVPLGGRLTLEGRLGIPVDTPGDLRSYRGCAEVKFRSIAAGNLEIEQATATAVYQDGKLVLSDICGLFPSEKHPVTGPPAGGEFAGQATLQLIPLREASGSFAVEGISLDRLVTLTGTQGDFAGRIGGEGQVSLDDLARAGEAAAWSGTASFRSEQLRGAGGLALDDPLVWVRLGHGVLAAERLSARLAGLHLSGTGGVRLGNAFPFRLVLALRGKHWQAVAPPSMRLGEQPVSLEWCRLEGAVTGALRPLTWSARGNGSGRGLTIGRVQVGAACFDWEAETRRLALSGLRAEGYGGEIEGDAVIPFSPKELGRADVVASDVDLAAVAASLNAMPLRIEGRANGSLCLLVADLFSGAPPDIAAWAEARSARTSICGITGTPVDADLEYRSGTLDYRLRAEALNGRVRIDGRVPPQDAGEGRVQIEAAQLTRVWQALGLSAIVGPLRGLLTADLTYRHAWEQPSSSGRFVLSRLQWEGREITEAVRGELRLVGTELRAREVSGALGEGVVRGQGAWDFGRPERSWFQLGLDRVDAGRLLAFWPAAAGTISGPVEARLHGTLGREWRGSGQVTLTRGRVAGVEVDEWRLPLSFSAFPDRGQATLDLRDSSAQLARGRASGQARLSWGPALGLDGQVRFIGLDVATLLGQAASDLGPAGSGRFSGSIDLSGSNVHSMDDLTASLEGTLQQSQALQLPVLRQLRPYLAPGQADSAFERGEVRAHLSHGVVRLRRFALPGTFLQLHAQGTMTLQGRLNLDVTAHTGPLLLGTTARALQALPIPVAGSIPGNLLAQAGQALSVGLVHLHVQGSVRQPSIQVQPLGPLTEDALRFFVDAAR